MVIEFRCSNPECGKTVRAPDGAAGRKGQCPKCGTVQAVPAPPPPPAGQEAEPPAPVRAEEDGPGRLTLIRYALRERRGTLIVIGCLAVVCGLAYMMFYFLSRQEPPSARNVGHSYLRSVLNAKKQAEGLRSGQALKVVHTQLMLYSTQHSGRFPDSLDELVRAGLDAGVLRPSPRSDQTFVYVPGLTNLSGPAKIVVYAPQADRDGQRLVLRINGSVETLDERTFQRQLASQRRKPPATSRPTPKPSPPPSRATEE